jgi:hypothetical protein
MKDFIMSSLVHLPVFGKFAKRYEISKRLETVEVINKRRAKRESVLGDKSGSAKTSELMKKINMTANGSVIR